MDYATRILKDTGLNLSEIDVAMKNLEKWKMLLRVRVRLIDNDDAPFAQNKRQYSLSYNFHIDFF